MTGMVLPRVGQRFVMAVRPPDWYAGKIGDEAVVEESSATGVYVLFDTGLRESFPPARFAAYFTPALPGQYRVIPKVDGPWIERTPSGRILLHR